ncbi:MAG TPA: hypothetical protein VHU83_06705 [Bryobacteraceae bacterium]|nr:hypothetical protein [Bryobacteraceae bacterium]
MANSYRLVHAHRLKTGKVKIHIKPSHQGLLHEELHVPEGEPIPEPKLEAAKRSSDPAERKRATFAENARDWHDK